MTPPVGAKGDTNPSDGRQCVRFDMFAECIVLSPALYTALR